MRFLTSAGKSLKLMHLMLIDWSGAKDCAWAATMSGPDAFSMVAFDQCAACSFC